MNRLRTLYTNPLGLALLIAALHGLAYLWLVPPWQHYDEPTHFERIYMIAQEGRLGLDDTYSQPARRLILRSMIAHGFQNNITGQLDDPDRPGNTPPLWIGVTQTGPLFLYYLSVSPPVWLLAQTRFYDAIELQLYVVRGQSLLLLLITIFLLHKLSGELFHPTHPLRPMLALTAALLPAFVDLMTAASDDVGAITLFTAFLWQSAALIRRGSNRWRWLAVLGLAVLCALTKTTTLIAVPLVALLAIVVNWRQQPRHLIIGGLVGLGLAIVLIPLLTLSWGAPAYWYRNNTGQGGLGREPAVIESTSDGHWWFAMPGRPARAEGGFRSFNLSQQLAPADVFALQGQTVTFGGWVWAERPTRITGLLLYGTQFVAPAAQLISDQPTYFSRRITIPADERLIGLRLVPDVQDDGTTPVRVYFDNLFVVAGELPPFQPPSPVDENWSTLQLNGQTYPNLLRNGSAEQAGPYLNPEIDRFARRYLLSYANLSVLPTAISDPRLLPGTLWLSYNLFSTFYAQFGWGGLQLPIGIYWVLMALTGAIVVAYARWLWQAIPKAEPTQVTLWLTLTALAILMICIALARQIWTIQNAAPGFSLLPARYIYPAIGAFLAIWLMGFWGLLGRPQHGWRLWTPIIGLGVLALYSLGFISGHYANWPTP